MATIREKKPGVWEVRVFTANDARGRPTQISRTVRGSKRDAQRMAASLEVGPGSPSPAGRSVEDVLDAWIDQNIDRWAPASSRDQQSRVRSIKQDKIARMPIAQLSIADVERWHTRLRRAGMQDAGIRNQHGALSAAFGQAMRWGWVSQNVVAMAQRKTTKKQPSGVMTLDDVRAAIAAAAEFDPAAALALRIAAMTGARRAELAALRWDDVDDDGMLTIDSAIEVLRHPGEPRELRDAPTKTGNARTMTLDPDTLNAIWELGREREPHGPWMFGVGPDLVPPDHIGWWWTRARKASGIDMKWRLHDLRHWSANVSIGQGHDVRTVAGRLGHSNPAMTLRVYAHAFAAADQALAAGLGVFCERTILMSANEWEHLLSVVQRFVGAGNSIVGGGFEPNQGGWTCTFRARLDPQLGDQAAAADPRLSFDPAADELSCSHCWSVIAGGDAAGPNGPARPMTALGEQDQTE